ncbi:uncharacterized protein VP01_2028g3 [Puccinia sorghi]|uniref:No apical meristem-associated C-terminal domain-containing protein n=1 Tax=Puccinia sorghi TaxID=27349 RepID=A0A0L6VB03_9BASI|nr:uncharacterized protein VP01_2028g3 [Puccinia sorghi]
MHPLKPRSTYWLHFGGRTSYPRRTYFGITSQAVSSAIPGLIQSPKVYQTGKFHQTTSFSLQILISTMKFSGFYNKVISNPPSGMTEANHIKFSKEEYYNNTQKLFVFEKHLALDNSTANSSSQLPNPPANSSSELLIENSSSPASPTGDETNRRPMGVKKAKRSEVETTILEKKLKILEKNVTEGQRQGSAFVRGNILQEQLNLIQQVEAEIKAQQLEISIMEKDPASLTNKFALWSYYRRGSSLSSSCR